MSTSGQVSPPSRIVIVADDLTSATDCGIQMTAGEFRTVIPLRSDCRIPSGTDIVALETDSRDIPPDEAYGLTRKALAPFESDPSIVFYKSIDSTLRGNLGAELDATLDSGSFDAAIIAPAFPTYGRTTVGGLQFLNGRPVHETEFGCDPTSTVTSSAIAARFAEQSRRNSAVVSIATQKSGAAAVFKAIEDGRKAGDHLLIFDASEEGHLKSLSGIIGSLPGRYLWVGSTGLSRYVPKAVGLKPRRMRRHIPATDGCVLVVAGSASETTRMQLDACAETAGFTEIRVGSQAIARSAKHERLELERVRRLLRASVGKADVVAVTLSANRHEIESTKAIAAARGLGAGEIESHLAHILAHLIAELLNDGTAVKGLVLTGGATAKMVVSELQGDAIEILDEIEPGIPLGHLSGRHGLLVVTKAGGFGSSTAILSSVERIAGHGQD